MPDALLFDFDGVLVDSERLHFRAFLEVAQTIGATFDYQTYLREFIGFDDRGVLERLIERSDAVPPNDLRPYVLRLCERKAEVFEGLMRDGGVEAVPGGFELAREARDAGVPIAVCSGAIRRDIDLALEAVGASDLFPVIVSADDVRVSKPDPATYRLGLERVAGLERNAGLTPARCLAIEDTAAGVESARGAGLQTLALTTTGPTPPLHRATRIHDSGERGLQGVTLATLRGWFSA